MRKTISLILDFLAKHCPNYNDTHDRDQRKDGEQINRKERERDRETWREKKEDKEIE